MGTEIIDGAAEVQRTPQSEDGCPTGRVIVPATPTVAALRRLRAAGGQSPRAAEALEMPRDVCDQYSTLDQL